MLTLRLAGLITAKGSGEYMAGQHETDPTAAPDLARFMQVFSRQMALTLLELQCGADTLDRAPRCSDLCSLRCGSLQDLKLLLQQVPGSLQIRHYHSCQYTLAQQLNVGLRTASRPHRLQTRENTLRWMCAYFVSLSPSARPCL